MIMTIQLITCLEGKKHDAGMLRDFHMLDDFELHAQSLTSQVLSVYGDSAYPQSLQALFRAGERRLALYNKNMSKVRTSVERSFGDVVNSWTQYHWKNVCCLYNHLQCSNMHLWQRFEYQICLNNFSVGKCLSHSTRYKVNNKNLQRSNYIWKTNSEPKCCCYGNY